MRRSTSDVIVIFFVLVFLKHLRDATHLSLEEVGAVHPRQFLRILRVQRHRLILVVVGVLLSDEEQGVVHQVVGSHELNVFEDPLTNYAHVSPLEAQEFQFFADRLEVDVLQAILGNFERWMHLTIDDTALQVELTQLVLHVQEEVVHEEDVNLANILHLNSIDAIDLCDHALWELLQMLEVLWKSLTQNLQLARIHRLD